MITGLKIINYLYNYLFKKFHSSYLPLAGAGHLVKGSYLNSSQWKILAFLKDDLPQTERSFQHV